MKLTGTKFWTEPAAKWSYFENCSTNWTNDNLYIQYNVTIPILDEESHILEADSFQVWNKTQPNRFCWLKYGGPEYILHNRTNDCYMLVESWWFDEESLNGHRCTTHNQKLARPEEIYYPENCFKHYGNHTSQTQIKLIDGVARIYCFGNLINVEGKSYECPDYVFETRGRSFELDGYIWNQTSTTKSSQMTITHLLSNKVLTQLKLEKMKFGINLTDLDAKWTIIERAKSLITSKLDLKPLQVFDPFAFLTNPFGIVSWLSNVFSGFYEFIKIILIIGAVCLGAVILAALSPLLNLFFIIIRLIKRSSFTVTNIFTRLRRSTNKKVTKAHRYWEELKEI